uniref:Putative nuclease HARBI1 n=1 Tax=Gadus morhua TaxID=8049 RepID=A0A8C5A0Z8_GADMO
CRLPAAGRWCFVAVVPRGNRVYRDRADFFMESDEWLLSRIRLPRHLLMELCNALEPQLRRETRRSNALPVPVQGCSTLGFLATGTFQREIGDRSGIPQPSISRTMPAVLAAIMSLSERYINFPSNNDQQTGIKRDFYAIARFPNVIGAVDCTHVGMKPPSINDYAYINRKSYHSVYVQIICDARMSILNMVARRPGGTHDSFIFQNSNVGHRLHQGVTKAMSATSTALTRRCPAGGTLLYSPEKTCNIILACGVLHNIALANGVPFADLQPVDPMSRDPWPQAPHARALRRREDLIRLF